MPLTNPPIKPKKDKPKNKSENIADDKKSVDSLDSRKEFFRLMAEKIKDKDFNINQAMAIKEELNKKEHVFEDQENERQKTGEESVVDNTEIEDNFDLSDEEDFIIEEGTVGSEKEKSSKEKNKEDKKSFKSIYLYKKMVYRFLFLTALLLVAVFYFSFVSMTIVIYSEKGSVDSNLNFYAYTNESSSDLERAIRASVTKIEIEENGTFQSSGVKKTGGEIVGKVKIINEYSKNQPLVATTRLLSSDDKLFRIKETVNVPAGGSVEVDVYADSISEEMAINPSKFIIPGLWIGIQDKIYAESYEKFEYRTDDKKYVMEKDINDAISSLTQKIIDQANTKAKEAISSDRSYVLDMNPNSAVISNDIKVGDEISDFEISVKNVISIISFETDDLIKLAKQKVSLETNQEVSEINANSLNFELINFNSSRNLAEISSSFLARTSTSVDDFIDKKHLSNLNEKQISAYLDNLKEIHSYELLFKPKFIKRSPILLDKIKIEYR